VITLIGALVALAVAIGGAISIYLKRSRAQKRAHDIRLQAMAHAALAAAKKKQAAAAGAAPAVETPMAIIREERECPFCAELILKKAKVCKHCGRDVEPVG
jgi:hypothetical protein